MLKQIKTRVKSRIQKSFLISFTEQLLPAPMVILMNHEEADQEQQILALRGGPAPKPIDDDGNELQIGDLVHAMQPSGPSPVVAFRTVCIDWDNCGEPVEPYLAVDCLVEWAPGCFEWSLARDLFRSSVGGAK